MSINDPYVQIPSHEFLAIHLDLCDLSSMLCSTANEGCQATALQQDPIHTAATETDGRGWCSLNRWPKGRVERDLKKPWLGPRVDRGNLLPGWGLWIHHKDPQSIVDFVRFVRWYVYQSLIVCVVLGPKDLLKPNKVRLKLRIFLKIWGRLKR